MLAFLISWIVTFSITQVIMHIYAFVQFYSAFSEKSFTTLKYASRIFMNQLFLFYKQNLIDPCYYYLGQLTRTVIFIPFILYYLCKSDTTISFV